ncbi:FtsQ-type POTRA domain-containing protein [Mycetocola sp. 2940]|uniref:FtsQ-type POTRA domain-containing protein n=1 Tax=Mycetocola sp. 2940 TaxID=3156452 RepID=UPI0033912210
MKRPSGFTPQRPSTPEPNRPGSARPSGPSGDPSPDARPAEPIPLTPSTDDVRVVSPAKPPGLREARRQRKRVERAEVRRFTAQARRRRRTWLFVLGGIAGLAALACLLAYTPILSVRTIQVEGAERVNSDAIVADLAGEMGSPFPMVDERAIKAALVSYPLIESYAVEARPPSTLVIRLVERTPVGALQTGEGFLIVDAAGVVVESHAEKPEQYPLIAVDGGIDAEGFGAAAAVLRALPGDLFARVDAVTATTKDDVRLTLRDSEATVVWGSAEESGLKAYTLAALMKAQPEVDEYDVSSPDVAVVR